ncbi:MAG: sialidase family protein [Polyangiaceae bacterium]
MKRRTRWACLLALGSLVACSSSPADEAASALGTSGAGANGGGGAGGNGAAGGSIGTYHPYAGVPPYDSTGVLDFALGLGGRSDIYEAQGAEMAGMVSRGLALDARDGDGAPLRQVYATFSQHDDIPTALQDFGVVHSDDAGATFGGYDKGVDLPPQFAIQLRDGRVLSYGFKPSARVDSDAGSQLTLEGQTSMDDGATWTKLQAKVDLPKMAGSIGSVGRLSGHPIQLADGTILLPWYGAFAGDKGSYRAELLASTDGGQTFTRRGSIAVPPANIAYPEADVVELEDGSLFSVFRHHQGSPQDGQTVSNLLFSTSSDAGATWSAPGNLNITFDGNNGPRIGINPQLALLPNGILALSSGRPDNFVAISTAGALMPGHVAFERALVSYVNYPSKTTAGYGSAVLRYHGSSGNTGLVTVDANRLAQIGDNCANGWGCPAADSGYTVGGDSRVWRRFVEAVTPDVGKIDLRGKVRRGEVAVDSDMTWTSSAHGRAEVLGAFDGSNDYWSSADRSPGLNLATGICALMALLTLHEHHQRFHGCGNEDDATQGSAPAVA